MYAKILVPVDGSATAQAGLAEAIKLARLSGGQIQLLHVLDLQPMAMLAGAGVATTQQTFDQLRDGGQDLLAQARAEVEAAGVPVQVLLQEAMAARVADLVVEQARQWGAELIVLGTHGRRGIGRALLGSDAEQVLRQAPVPVLLVRGGEGSH